MSLRQQKDYESHFVEQDEEVSLLNQEFRESNTPIFTKTAGSTGDRKKQLLDNDRVTIRDPLLLTSALLSLPFRGR